VVSRHLHGAVQPAAQSCEDLGWTEAELGARRRGEGAKLELAVQLRAETTMTLQWIAARLQMGTGASLSNLLSAQRRAKG